METAKGRRKPERLKPSYKPMEITLIKRDKTRTDLRRELKISPSTLAKMSNGEFVALDVIALICEYLDCKIEEVVEFIEIKETAN
ncbi:helix-turn-helix transcriptional regulator [Robertmurraya sp. DFI.2.37]|uniref:helix-turn-helix domain-containing protein n=1 Tax=Robertmurraya sp. DFI.2.37 TaxID=3031819 RepID=UPI0023DB4C6B|nr:helix-turn-helix transcriptional regulator [Robertmurraya sp. DFI.2.37]MDF1510189.1 helix-turn-helix transcriptional regulator [Robertmurraya sp. DFI.2.37]